MQERDFARRSFGRSVASMPRPALPPTGKHGISPALCAPGSPPRYYNLSYGHPPALGRRDGSDARRPYHFGAASLRRRFLFSARQAVDCISPMRPGLPRLPRAGRMTHKDGGRPRLRRVPRAVPGGARMRRPPPTEGQARQRDSREGRDAHTPPPTPQAWTAQECRGRVSARRRRRSPCTDAAAMLCRIMAGARPCPVSKQPRRQGAACWDSVR